MGESLHMSIETRQKRLQPRRFAVEGERDSSWKMTWGKLLSDIARTIRCHFGQDVMNLGQAGPSLQQRQTLSLARAKLVSEAEKFDA
jgi:hypothetical protein